MNTQVQINSVIETDQDFKDIPERDHALARLFRKWGLIELAELYEPRPGHFVADKLHKHKPL